MEKIYVAIGSDLQEGFKTLEWVLQKWSLTNNPLIGGIALVHVSRDISKEFVSSPCKCQRGIISFSIDAQLAKLPRA